MAGNPDWSPRANYLHKGAASARTKAVLALEHMRQGPHLDKDGITLVIPSEWYRQDIARFWRSLGFRYHSDDLGQYYRQWTRDTRQPLHGKRYTPQAWLQSARRKFSEFWPDLDKDHAD